MLDCHPPLTCVSACDCPSALPRVASRCVCCAGAWAAQVAFSAYLLLGPWLLYPALTGYPPALMFHFGVLARVPLPPQARRPGGAASLAEAVSASATAAGTTTTTATGTPTGWLFVGTADTMFVSLLHTLLCLLPTRCAALRTS